MRSKWMRYSSSSASRSPCWPRSTRRRIWSRSGDAAFVAVWLSSAEDIRTWMPRSRNPESHPCVTAEAAQVDDAAQGDDVFRVLGVERHRAVLADAVRKLVRRLRADEHAQRLPAVEADLDPHLLSHVPPPPR